MSEQVDPELLGAVDRGYAAWNSNDVEAFLDTIHPEIVFETAGIFPGLAARYVGHEELRLFWDEFQEPWEWLEISYEEVLPGGHDELVLRVRFRGRGRGGIEVEREFGQRYVIEDGLLRQLRAFPTWEEALAATR